MHTLPEKIVINWHAVFVGLPGCGKTTHANLLGGLVPHTRVIDMSQVLGIAGTYDQEFELVRADYQAKGELVPTPITMEALMRFLKSVHKGDKLACCGVPRDEEQALRLIEGIAESDQIFDYPIKTFHFNVEPAEMAERIVRRALAAQHAGIPVRVDDTKQEVVLNRMKVHAEREDKVLAVLRQHGEVVPITSMPIDDTFRTILEKLQSVDQCLLRLPWMERRGS